MAIDLCKIDPELKEKLNAFQILGKCTAIIMKIDPQKRMVEFDEEHDNMTLEEVAEKLPERQPRYIAYRFKLNHGDGRISYPACFILLSPEACEAGTGVMYNSSKSEVVKEGKFIHVFELREKEGMTDAWLKDKLLAK